MEGASAKTLLLQSNDRTVRKTPSTRITMSQKTNSSDRRTETQSNGEHTERMPDAIYVVPDKVIDAYQQNQTNTNSKNRIRIWSDGTTEIGSKDQYSMDAEVARIKPRFVISDPGTDPHAVHPTDDNFGEFLETWHDIVDLCDEVDLPGQRREARGVDGTEVITTEHPEIPPETIVEIDTECRIHLGEILEREAVQHIYENDDIIVLADAIQHQEVPEIARNHGVNPGVLSELMWERLPSNIETGIGTRFEYSSPIVIRKE